jgi:hypothetical protein
MQHSKFERPSGARQLITCLCALAALAAGTVAGAATLAPPTISGTPIASITAGQYYAFTPKASGPAGHPLSFSISGQPRWVGFNRLSGQLLGMPTAASVGKYSNIVITVSDGVAQASLRAFAITVAAASKLTPTITGAPATTVAAGNHYTFTPQASGPTGYKLSFSIVAKPRWATFNSVSGQLSGSPTTANIGKYSNIVITVSDGPAGKSLPPFSIAVAAAAGSNTPPTISGTPLTTATVGKAYAFTPKASDSDGDSISFSVQNKPTWASFSIASGTLSGTPTASNVGSYSGIVISASDGHSSAALPAFSIAVASASAPPTATTLAQKYPGDVGMASDPSVVWSENFEEGSVSAVTSRYSSYTDPAGMTLPADHPANSAGQHAIELTAGGSNAATDFFKSLGTGYDELWFRYYAKYVGSGPWHHTGLWIGGSNPPLTYPAPHAGLKPAGNDRFSLGLEPDVDATGDPMDFYTYWMGMHSWKANPTGASGDYWGNTLVHDAEFRMQSNTWVCYEVHLKLNPNPATGSGAVLEVWQNDSLIRRFDDTGPYGYWVADKFCPSDADGSECTTYRPANPVLALLNQQWRSTSALKINYIWPQNYNDAGTNSSLLLDDMVAAKQRIGCTVRQ